MEEGAGVSESSAYDAHAAVEVGFRNSTVEAQEKSIAYVDCDYNHNLINRSASGRKVYGVTMPLISKLTTP